MFESQSSDSIWSVYQLTVHIKNRLEEDPQLKNVWIRGELSNFKHHSRGHMYFTLKDDQARIQAVMFYNYNRFLRFQPQNGMKLLVRGDISVYERDGQYQIYVKEMQPDGIGNLYLAYEQLKENLRNEGLFANNRPLPSYPKKIALITSPTGAAIRDLLSTIRRRYPLVHIVIVPVLVQGEMAPVSIIDGLDKAYYLDGLDLIIIGRGGGSIEELWAFNDEGVARKLFQSPVPVISAVGHETDFTIADFVADVRAATPTAAAELSVPHVRELHAAVLKQRQRLRQAISQLFKRQVLQVHHLSRSIRLSNPKQRLIQYEQQLDRLYDGLRKNMKRIPSQQRVHIEFLQKRLQRLDMFSQINNEKQRLQRLQKRLHATIMEQLRDKEKLLAFNIQQLDALSPTGILKRGYALTYDQDKQMVKSVKHLSPGQLLYVQLSDGYVESTIWAIEEEESLWDKKKK